MGKPKYTMGAIRYEPNPLPEGQQRQVVYFSPMKEAKDQAEEEIEKLTAARARTKRMEELGLGPPARGASERSDNPKRYLVDPQTGRIDVVEDGQGEYTYKEALLVSASIKGGKGQYDDAITLINAAKALSEGGAKDKTEPEKKKEFWVGDTGEIIHDPEHGELSLSEARAISQSKRVLQGPEPITPDKLELLKRDVLDLTKQVIQDQVKKTGVDSQEAPFSIDEKGNIQLNPKAKLSATDFLLYQLLRQERHGLYRDSQGNVMALPEFLEVKKWEREEDRKDERNKILTDVVTEGKKYLPFVVEALRPRGGSTEEQSKSGEPETEASQQPPSGQVMARCPSCNSETPVAPLQKSFTCQGCGAENTIEWKPEQ